MRVPKGKESRKKRRAEEGSSGDHVGYHAMWIYALGGFLFRQFFFSFIGSCGLSAFQQRSL